jgi:hypothetical protein
MAPSDSFENALRLVLDRQDIAQVINRLARAVDRRDKDLVDACFHEDATDDHGIFKGTARAFSEWVMVQLANYQRTQHSISNQLIEIEGDLAVCESYFHAHHVMETPQGEINIVVAGRYLDRLERRENAWKIAHRGVVYDWNRIDPSTDGWKTEPIASQLARGQASAQDPSYALKLH